MSDSYTDVPVFHGATYSEESCRPVREVLNIVGNKWSILVVGLLENGTKRFSELQRNVDGISQRMLTRTLRELERNGLLTRTVMPTVPPSVYDALTPLGHTLLVHAKELANWARQNHPKMLQAQQEFDGRD